MDGGLQRDAHAIALKLGGWRGTVMVELLGAGTKRCVSTVASARQEGGSLSRLAWRQRVTHACGLVVAAAISCLWWLAVVVVSVACLA
jgi:hypothetical protein